MSDSLELVREALTKATPKRVDEWSSITNDTRIKDLGIDSISLLETIGYIEDALGCDEFEDDMLNKIVTIGDLAILASKAMEAK